MGTHRRPLPEDRLWQPITGKWFAVIFGGALAYSILRYHVASDVSWSHFPLFILNKATSLAAVVLVACAYLIRPVFHLEGEAARHRLVLIKFCGLMGFSLAFMHALFSVVLLNPSYFAKFFGEDGRLNVVGELGITVGVVGLWAVAIPAITTLPKMAKELGGIRWKRTQRMGYLCLLLVVAHMVVFGWKGWMTPSTWPWGLPPISLLAAVAAAVPILFKLRRVRESHVPRADNGDG